MNNRLPFHCASQITVPPELAIPLVEEQFIRRQHNDWLQLRKHSFTWMLKHQLIPADLAHIHAEGLRYADLVAGYYVGAPIAALRVISDFSIWFFIWDDHHSRYALHRRDRAWGQLRDVLHMVLNAPSKYLCDPNPLVRGLADCVHRFDRQLNKHWSTRFSTHFHAVIEAYDQEYRERIAHYVPFVEEYISLRSHTFGYLIWLDCLELAADRELPPEVIAWDEYRQAGFASQEFSGWYNDLCSLSKELACGERHNLGISLIHHQGLSMSQAMAEIHHRTTVRVQDFLLAEQAVLHRLDAFDLTPEIDRTVRHCLFNMRNWISSVYWFHHESDRYRIENWQDSSKPPYISDSYPEGDELSQKKKFV